MKAIIRFLHTVRQIIAGRQLVDNENKFRIMCLATAAVHLIFCIVMGLVGAEFLCCYNIVIVLLYVFLGLVAARKGAFRLILVLLYLEIEFHAILATFLLGWKWEFMLYTISLLPAAFYFPNSLSNRGKHLRYSVILSAFVILCYFMVSTLAVQHTPYYDTTAHEGLRVFIRYFNIVLAFLLQLTFSLLFALENRFMENLLEKENIELGIEASLDPLTKILNRRSMSRHLEEEMGRLEKEERIFCVIMADIDDFKRINDTCGHDAGDNVLTGIAEILADELREKDLSCRWGGEEFLLLIHGLRDDAFSVAERIRKRVSAHEFQILEDRSIHVTLTLGISEARKELLLRELIEEADRKMYYGKNHGKNQVVA